MNRHSQPTGRDVYVRSSDFEARASSLSLRAVEWDLALSLDGRATVSELAQALEMDWEEVAELIDGLEALGLVATERFTLVEYLARPDDGAAPVSAPETPAAMGPAAEHVEAQPAAATPEAPHYYEPPPPDSHDEQPPQAHVDDSPALSPPPPPEPQYADLGAPPRVAFSLRPTPPPPAEHETP